MTGCAYDPVSRLSSLTQDLTGNSNDVTINNLVYNPASQITSLQRSNDAYAFTNFGLGGTSTPANGLNQLATRDGVPFAYDANGNLTTDPTTNRTFAYDALNRLTASSLTGGASGLR